MAGGCGRIRRPEGNPIHSIDFIDQEEGWAASGWYDLYLGTGSGEILDTSDGGAKLDIGQTHDIPAEFHRLRSVPKRAGLWATGMVLKTTDGGTTRLPYAPGTTEPLDRVFFKNALDGWAVGGWSYNLGSPTSVIVHSTDGGATWQQQYYNSQATGPLTGVEFVSSTTGWAVGADGGLATTDGGAHWAQTNSPTATGLSDVCFGTPASGWIVGSTTIWHTTDAGASWGSQTVGANLVAVRTVSPTVVYAVGADGSVLRTTDGGATWTSAATGTTSDLTAVDFINAGRGWIVGTAGYGSEFGALLLTTDGGMSWHGLSSSTTQQNLYSTDFIDADRGWAVGDAGTVLHTTDGGSSWAVQQSGVTDALYSVDFVDADSGWTVGGSSSGEGTSTNAILHTTDGGSTWQRQYYDATANVALAGVKFVSSTTGWAVGGDSPPVVLHTTDGGKTWTPQTTGAPGALYGVDFLSSTTGWLLGNDNSEPYVLCTTDGGLDWSEHAVPTTVSDTWLTSIDFVSATTGYVAGGHSGYGGFDDIGEIDRTTDGGLTWAPVYFANTGVLGGVRFADQDNGWAVGGADVLHTTDGGASWTAQVTGIWSGLNAVSCPGSTDCWAVGSGGTIIDTTSGGVPSPPVNVATPDLAGVAAVGEDLTCPPGAWTGVPTPTFYYQWLRDGAPIDGATSAAYAVQTVDQAHDLSCQVTATSVAGQTSVTSNSLLVPLAPASVQPPVVSGTPFAGQQLSCSSGTWTGEPKPTLAYQWLCDGHAIATATGPGYTAQAADQAHSLCCEVTATNVAGQASTTSNSLFVPLPPANTSLPAITGTPALGDELTCSSGTWVGDPAPSLSYRWLRDAAPIAGASGTTYVVTSTDLGHSLSCEVTATNVAGHASVTSTEVEVATAPAESSPPGITGTPIVGASMWCSTGAWTGRPTPSFTYEWLRDGTPMAACTGTSYTVQAADLGHVLSCEVTASNIAGQVSATTSTVRPLPRPTVGLKATPATLMMGHRLVIAGVVHNLVPGHSTVSIWRRSHGKLILLKSLTASGAGAFRWTTELKKRGRLTFLASYVVDKLSFKSKPVVVRVKA